MEQVAKKQQQQEHYSVSCKLTGYPTGIFPVDYQNFSKLFPGPPITCYFCYLMIGKIRK